MAKKGSFLIFLILILFAFSFSQQKIGFIDSNRVLQESIGGKEVLKQLNDARAKKQSEYNAKLKEISDLRNRYSTQRYALSEDALNKLLNDIDQKETALKRFQEDAERELANLQARLFKKLQDEVNPIIEQIGREKGFTLILDLSTQGIIYFDKNADITAELIKRYDEKKSASSTKKQ